MSTHRTFRAGSTSSSTGRCSAVERLIKEIRELGGHGKHRERLDHSRNELLRTNVMERGRELRAACKRLAETGITEDRANWAERNCNVKKRIGA